MEPTEIVIDIQDRSGSGTLIDGDLNIYQHHAIFKPLESVLLADRDDQKYGMEVMYGERRTAKREGRGSPVTTEPE